MILFIFWLKLMGAAIFGLTFQLIAKNIANSKTAIRADDREYNLMYFIKKDRGTILGTFCTIGFVFLLCSSAVNDMIRNADRTLKPYAWDIIWLSNGSIAEMIVITFCATVSYMGLDFALKLLGRTSEELKDKLQNFKSPN